VVADDQLVPRIGQVQIRLQPPVMLHPIGQPAPDQDDVFTLVELDLRGARRDREDSGEEEKN